MDDVTLLKTLKNGVVIAGHEMGPVGDHWPAIHAISKGLDEEFESLHRNEAVLGELEFHMATAFRLFEEAAEHCTPEVKKEIMTTMKTMWDNYYAIFEPIDSKFQPDADDLIPEGDTRKRYIKIAAKIMKDMGVTI